MGRDTRSALQGTNPLDLLNWSLSTETSFFWADNDSISDKLFNTIQHLHQVALSVWAAFHIWIFADIAQCSGMTTVEQDDVLNTHLAVLEEKRREEKARSS